VDYEMHVWSCVMMGNVSWGRGKGGEGVNWILPEVNSDVVFLLHGVHFVDLNDIISPSVLPPSPAACHRDCTLV